MYGAAFGAGSRVKVVKQRKYPGEKLIGLIGTVRTDSGSNVSVVFDRGIRNPRSSYGAYYFKPVELVEVDENDNEIIKENKMNNNNITNYLNLVRIQFTDADRQSTYVYANFDPGIKVGDTCVAKYGDNRYGVAKVVEVIYSNDVETAYEIVATVDMTAYEERVANRAKAAELKTKMQERAKQLQDIALYQMLAKDDPAMMELLKEYQALPKL